MENDSDSLPKPFPSAYDLHIYPFEKRQQVSTIQAAFALPAVTERCKLTALQALAPDPESTGIERQDLEHGPAPIDKHEPVSTGWVFIQMPAHARRQAIE